MVFWEGLYYRPIKNSQGLNPGEYPYLHRLHYYNTRIKRIRARGKGPRDLKTY